MLHFRNAFQDKTHTQIGTPFPFRLLSPFALMIYCKGYTVHALSNVLLLLQIAGFLVLGIDFASLMIQYQATALIVNWNDADHTCRTSTILSRRECRERGHRRAVKIPLGCALDLAKRHDGALLTRYYPKLVRLCNCGQRVGGAG